MKNLTLNRIILNNYLNRYKEIFIILLMTDLNKFCCLICKYSTKTNANLKKHFTSKKHESNSNPPVVEVPTNFHSKTCNKYYRSKPGLWKHVKLCKSAIHNTIISENESNANNKILSELIKMNELSKNQKIEMKKMTDVISSQALMLADLKQNQQVVQTTVNNNNYTTINNFNVNIFLNERCGNAINFEDFIKNILFEHTDSKLMIDSYRGRPKNNSCDWHNTVYFLFWCSNYPSPRFKGYCKTVEGSQML